jgi:hypothetical protein
VAAARVALRSTGSARASKILGYLSELVGGASLSDDASTAAPMASKKEKVRRLRALLRFCAAAAALPSCSLRCSDASVRCVAAADTGCRALPHRRRPEVAARSKARRTRTVRRTCASFVPA